MLPSFLRSLPLLLGFALAACGDPATGSAPRAGEALRITADVGQAAVSTLVVEVTAADIPARLAFNIDVVNGTAAGSIRVPAGQARTITVRALSGGGTETHRGSRTVDVRAGTNPTVSVTLVPVDGDQPIEAVLGSIVVTVNPQTGTLPVGGTLRLQAEVRDGAGAAVAGTVRWATLNQARATVDAAGLVTARDTGAVDVVASYAGVGAVAHLRVNPAASFAGAAR
jgi:hypothetical protein